MSACFTSETVYQVTVKFGVWNPHSVKLLDKCNFSSEWSSIAPTLCEVQITLLILPRVTSHAKNMFVIYNVDLTAIYTFYIF